MPRPAPPPAISRPAPNGKPTIGPKKFGESNGVINSVKKIVLYGPGGVGKSALCSHIQQIGFKPKFLDIAHGTTSLDVKRVAGVENWEDLRSALHSPEVWEGCDAIVLDDLTTADQWANEWVLKNIPKITKNGGKEYVSNIKDYGWNAGAAHVYETYLQLLADLDMHYRAGRQIICIAHECVNEPENPGDDNYAQYQPRLQTGKKGENSIRHRVMEWCDHLLFIDFDVFVDERGKGIGAGTRTIYPIRKPAFWAKSHDLDAPIKYELGSAELWKQLFKK